MFQLPPNWEVNVERFENFLKALPRGHRYAFEFRDASWNDPRIFALLKKHRAAYCIFDLAGFQSPLEITADFTYIRLREWGLQASYVYFDNDQAGYAALNALRLKKILHV